MLKYVNCRKTNQATAFKYPVQLKSSAKAWKNKPKKS